MRDSAFYALSIVLVGIFILSGEVVEWWEAVILLLAYALYILWMTRNEVARERGEGCCSPGPR